MGSFSIWHWLVVGIIILLLFGKGRFSEMMGDVAKGIKSFKRGMTEEEENAAAAPPQRLNDSRPLDPRPVEARPVDSRPVDPVPVEPVRPAPDERREP